MKKNIYRKLKMFACYSFRGLLLQLFFVNLIFAMSPTEAQKLDKIKISVNMTNVTLQEAFHTIEQKSNLTFFYDSKNIPLDENVSLSFEESTVEEVLTKLAQDLGLSFSQVNNLIIVKKINIQKKNPDKNARGGIKGVVKGSDTKSSLPYATIIVVGTNNGTATDIDGNYILRNIESAKHQISISYVGYKTKVVEVEIKPNQISEVNVVLEITSVEGQEVVITAQRTGQQKAINDQIQSNVIKNVVAADRLQENPDANAAEAIGRLPGVSLIRSGGEGTGVVLRGLDPKYTQVLLDGIPLPSTDNNTRATGISDISQYALQGVEVFKSTTPDMEGDAVAGAINLTLSEAPNGFKYNLMAQGGYNDLNNYWKNYKFVGDVSNRFFNDNLGVMLSLDAESVNRGDQSLSASYETKTIPASGLAPLYAGLISLNDIKRINYKGAGTLVVDYRLSSETKLFWYNFFSHSDQDYTQVSKSYDINSGGINYNINDAPNNYSELYVSSLKAKHEFPLFQMDEGFAYTQSHVYTPDSRNWTFYYSGTGLTQHGDMATQSLPLNQILALATDQLSTSTLNKFYLYDMNRQANDLIEKQINTYFDVKVPFNIGDYISAYVKFGGKYKDNSRDRNYDSRHAGISVIGDIPQFGEYATKSLPWAGISGVGTLSMLGLDDYNVSNFLKGQYNFSWYPNINRLNQIFDWWNNFSNYYLYTDPKDMPSAFSGGKLGLYPNWYDTKMNTQEINEKYYAGYIMGEFNLGNMFVLIPGVRYEKVKDNLNGWWIETIPYPNLYHASGYATDSTHNDGYWLPNIHLKIKPNEWIQTLFSFTQTLNRPDYNMLIPNVYLNRSGGTEFYQSGNPDLKPELWTNYDAQVTVFGDKIGLVSLGGFYKKVKDMIWTPSTYRTPGQPWTFGAGQYFTDNSVVLITVPQNFNYPVYLKGLEFEAQTSLWYLPQPFNHISLNVNFTFINSQTTYKYSKTSTVVTGYTSRGIPITKLVATDSAYSGPMLNQPKSIANFSFGYNYKGFNLWLSYQYTGEIITSEPNMVEFEVHKSKFARWDLQIAQKLPIEGLEALFNFANINNPIETQNNLGDPRPTYMEYYGWTMDFGIRYRL